MSDIRDRLAKAAMTFPVINEAPEVLMMDGAAEIIRLRRVLSDLMLAAEIVLQTRYIDDTDPMRKLLVMDALSDLDNVLKKARIKGGRE